jgi:antitoxin VapB
MSINIKNPRVVEEVRILADKLGLGLTEAIDDAVKARLAQLEAERQAEIARKIKALDEIHSRIKHLIPPGATSSCDDMYDEDGLPA